MTVTYRAARLDDAAPLRDLFEGSFIETFGHLYRPADLQEFLDGNTLAKWQANLTDPQIAIHVAEADGDL
ncbi:MAG: GNAT family N-acetyltransferase, partial [Sphingomonas sp.]